LAGWIGSDDYIDNFNAFLFYLPDAKSDRIEYCEKVRARRTFLLAGMAARVAHTEWKAEREYARCAFLEVSRTH
jgi:hypothetical protein